MKTKVNILYKRILNLKSLKERKLVVTREKHFFDFCLSSGNDFIYVSVTSKTVFQRIGPLLEVEKFANFIVDLRIVKLLPEDFVIYSVKCFRQIYTNT